jgi:hypothetical protein
LHAAKADRAVVHLRVHVGQDLIPQIADVEVAAIEAVLRRPQIRSLVERVAHRPIHVDRLFLERQRVARLEHRGPEIGGRGVENQRPEVVLRPLDQRLSDNDPLFVTRDLRLRLDDVDRRQRPDLDALPVVLQRLLRQRQRFLLGLQVVDRGREIPVRVLDVARGLDDHRLELDIGEIANLPAAGHPLPNLVDRSIAEQRLREIQREVRLEPRVEGVAGIVAREPRVVPGRGVVGAPRQRLGERHAGEELAGRGARLRAGEDVDDRLFVGDPRDRRGELRGPERSRLRDGGVLNLRIVALDLDAEVLLEAQLDGLVDRQPPQRLARL